MNPNFDAIEVARNLRRQGKFKLALKGLYTLVFKQGRLQPEPLALEEYALSLAQTGAPEAALNLLEWQFQQCKKANAVYHPVLSMARAAAYTLSWQHAAARADLEEACRHWGEDAYLHWVCYLNSLWCLLYIDGGRTLIEGQDEHQRRLAPFPILSANFQACLAKAHLLMASDYEMDAGSNWPEQVLAPYDRLVFGLCRWGQRFRREGQHASLRKEIRTLRHEALSHELWELHREMVLWEAVVFCDLDLARCFLWGSPFATISHYFHRVCRAFKGDERLFALLEERDVYWGACQGQDSCYIRRPEESVPHLCLVSETLKGHFTWDQFTILSQLASDSYRPLSHAQLACSTSQAAFYLPERDDARVHMSLLRLRQRLRERSIDWKVESVRSQGFLLRPRLPLLHLPSPRLHTVSRNQAIHRTLCDILPDDLFERSTLEVGLGISEQKAGRLLRELNREGLIARSGLGRKQRYSLLV